MLYLFGYDTATADIESLTFEQLEKRTLWAKIHHEVRRRLLGLFDASDGRVGIGGGWRSDAAQAAEFVRRHDRVTTTAITPLWYDGSYWVLKPGMAPLAPPDFSYHQSTLDGFALAADLIGDLRWAHAHAAEFRLRDFSDLKKPEAWHFQPVEIPTSRRTYNTEPNRYKLQVWNPPATTPPPPLPPEEDDMLPIVTNEEVFLDTPPGTWKWALMDDGVLRWMDPVEWETRGSQVGKPWKNDSIARHGVV